MNSEESFRVGYASHPRKRGSAPRWLRLSASSRGRERKCCFSLAGLRHPSFCTRRHHATPVGRRGYLEDYGPVAARHTRWCTEGTAERPVHEGYSQLTNDIPFFLKSYLLDVTVGPGSHVLVTGAGKRSKAVIKLLLQNKRGPLRKGD